MVPPRRYLKSTTSGSITIHNTNHRRDHVFIYYYELYRNSKDPVQYRGMLVEYALKHGIKPTAQEFKTTPKPDETLKIQIDEALSKLREF